MALTWGDVSDLLEMRARDVGILDDAAALVLRAYGVLQQTLDTYALPAYTATAVTIGTTSLGVRTMALPTDFGRPLPPYRQLQRAGGNPGTGQSGFFLLDGTGSRSALRMMNELEFRQQLSATTSRPYRFTRQGRSIILDPPPDNNNGSNYTIEASYIKQVPRPTLGGPSGGLDDVVLLDEPGFLIPATLAQIAADKGLSQAGTLANEAHAMLSALINNRARQNQQYYQQQWDWRARRR